MINRIRLIKNIASYKDFKGSTIQDFNKFNLIYGENGSGKTILSKLFTLYSEIEDSEIKQEIHTNIFNDSSIVEMDINGATSKLSNLNFPKEKIYVFNSLFVSNYLYDGSNSNPKRFRTTGNMVARIETPNIRRLQERNIRLEEEIGLSCATGLTKDIADLESKVSESVNTIRIEWNSLSVLKGKNLVKLESNFKSTSRKFTDIDKNINKHLKELELMQRDDYTSDLHSLRKLDKCILDIDFRTIIDDINLKINNIAKQDVVEKIMKYTNLEAISNVPKWFESGLTILTHQRENNNLRCPLCNSSLGDTINDIISDYESYFDMSLKELHIRLNKHIDSISSVLSILSNRDEITLNSLISKYKAAMNGDIAELEQFEIEDFQKILTDLIVEIKEKFDNNKYYTELDLSQIESKIENYNNSINEFIYTKETIISYITNRNTSQSDVLLRGLFYEKFSAHLVNITNLSDPINDLGALKDEKSKKENEMKENKLKINEEIMKLQIESAKINEYLIKLNIFKFKISIEDQLKVMYTDGTSIESLKHSLSEGEKTTLAFAYFLSKVSYEVGKENYKDYVIFMDDPISSIDEDRMFTTASMICEEFKFIQQLFISSHSFKFLRIMNNFLKFYNRKNSKKQEMNLYKTINNNGSEIRNLPVEVGYFTTLYYSKLQLLIKYIANTPLSEDEKKSIPNCVRIVLESFLSFKFGYLKGKTYGNTPGMKELFDSVKKEDDVIFDNLVEVDGINKDNWKDNLDFLFIHYTDMFSHGNPSAVVDDEPPTTDIELKEICNTTISLIKFLDGIHFKIAIQNCVR